MSIQHTINLYGSELAYALMSEDEEMAYFFNELKDNADPEKLGKAIAAYFMSGINNELAEFLLSLATAVQDASDG